VTEPGALPPPPSQDPRAVPYGAPPPSSGRRNAFGTAALVLGILGVATILVVVPGLLLGILAIVFGVLGRGRARRGEADNGNLAIAGLVLGTVAVVASAALLAFGVSLLNSDEGKRLQDCVSTAAGDRAAAQVCQDEFARSGAG